MQGKGITTNKNQLFVISYSLIRSAIRGKENVDMVEAQMCCKQSSTQRDIPGPLQKKCLSSSLPITINYENGAL